jgi:hypothetical protein
MTVIDARALFEKRRIHNQPAYLMGKMAVESAMLGVELSRQVTRTAASVFVNLFWFGCLCVIVLL